MSDTLQVRGINAKGFGVIPKLVMQDRRLSAQAKAIYAYFCSYAGAGRTAFPSRNKITADLEIGIKAYYKHLNQLKKYGYIKSEQKNKNGVFQRNVYTLPDSLPCVQNEHTEPCSQNDHSEPCSHFAYTQNDYTNNNSLKNKQYSFKSNSQSVAAAPIGERNADGRDETDTAIERKIKDCELRLKENIGYEDFRIGNPHDLRLIDEIIAIVVDVMVTPGAAVALDGENKPRELVRRRLMELGYEDIEHVVLQFKGLTTPVKRKRQYLLTMLYNSKLELDAHYTNLVNSDYGYFEPKTNI